MRRRKGMASYSSAYIGVCSHTQGHGRPCGARHLAVPSRGLLLEHLPLFLTAVLRWA